MTGSEPGLAKQPTAGISSRPLLMVILLNLLLAGVVLLKDLKLAAYLGTSVTADAFFLAFFIPDAIGSNILAMSLATACVPVFTNLAASPRLARQVVGKYALGVVGWCLPLWAALWAVQKPLLAVMAGRLAPSVLDSAALLFRLMLPVVLVYPLTALASGFLQAKQRFILPALGPVIQNGIWLLALLTIGLTGLPTQSAVRWLAIALPLSALITCCVLATGVIRTKQQTGTEPTMELPHSLQDSTRQRLLPSVAIALCTQMMLFGERYWAGSQGTGVVSALNYAYRLAQFPLWTFVAAIAMVTLPSFSDSRSSGHEASHRQLAAASMNLVLVLAVPTGLILSLLAAPIVTLLMKHGNFDASSIMITSSILSGYALALTSLAVVLMGQRILLAKGQLLLPAVLYGPVSAFTFVVDGFLVDWLGPMGIGYGAALGAGLNAGLMLRLLLSKGILPASYLRQQVARLLLSHLPLAVVLIGCARAWPRVSGLGGPGASVLPVFLAGAGLVSLAAWLWGLQCCGLLQPILVWLGITRKFGWDQRKGRLDNGSFQMLDRHSGT